MRRPRTTGRSTNRLRRLLGMLIVGCVCGAAAHLSNPRVGAGILATALAVSVGMSQRAVVIASVLAAALLVSVGTLR